MYPMDVGIVNKLAQYMKPYT